MTWKNRLYLLIVSLLRLFVPANKRENRFLIVSTTALGDSLWATPALEALRASFPESHIVLLTSSIGEEALRYNPWCNKTFKIDQPLISLWKALKKEKIDTVLLFHFSQRYILPLTAILGATTIIGTAKINKGLDSLLTQSLDNGTKHEIVRRLEIVERVGAKRRKETLSFFLKKEEQKHPQLSSGPWVALHPGSKDSFKRWPAVHFGTVGRKLQQMGYQILITGSGKEIDLMKHVGAHIPGASIADPKLSLRSFAHLLTEVKLLISNDSGPVHLASALSVPLIALYSATDPLLCGPHHAEGTVISKPPTCEPCLKKKCLLPFCLMQIGPEEVIVEAKKLLQS